MNLIERSQSGQNVIAMKVHTMKPESLPKLADGYGQKPWGILGQCQNQFDSWLIYQAKSILTMDGKVGPNLPVEQARDVVNWAKRGK